MSLRIGIAGLGGAGQKLLPWFDRIDGVALAGAADLRSGVRAAFTSRFDRPAHESVAALCAAGDVDAVYVATPSDLHAEHALLAIDAGKHVICEKPLALTIADCDRVISAADAAGVRLLQAHSKVLDGPIRAMRELAASGELGAVFQLDTWLFNDWMRRPRLASELDVSRGGGVLFRQGPLQVDIARYLVGRPVVSVRARVGRRPGALATDGHYAAQLHFEGGAVASLALNGYGYFAIDELARGAPSRPPRPRLHDAIFDDVKYAGGLDVPVPPDRPAFCGLTVLSLDRGVVRQAPGGLYVHTESGREERPVPEDAGRGSGLVELRDALRDGRPVFPDGAWARDTLAVCLAMRQSSERGEEVGVTTGGLS